MSTKVDDEEEGVLPFREDVEGGVPISGGPNLICVICGSLLRPKSGEELLKFDMKMHKKFGKPKALPVYSMLLFMIG